MHAMFHDYMESFPTHQMRKALIELFKVLDQKPDEIRNLILKDASENFDWSKISPTINIFSDIKDNVGDLAYVCCWYKKLLN